MLTNIDLKLITPSDESELRAYRKEFEFLFNFVPQKLTKDEVWAFLSSNTPYNTLVIGGGVLLGMFALQVYSKSVLIHGVVRPDIGDIVHKPSRLKIFVYRIIFEAVFGEMGKQKVILKAPPSNRDVAGFAMMWGFTRLKYMDKGEIVWVLAKDEYLRRINKCQKLQP